ncbi:hypothetical protein M427DRAFT_50064 [Gonapodya prolifera JEL478]|uniref:Uncharacterized protein n=1 Tax=Gonapodya prolifera (strain JEL478) TaxID=1344416 RepID=A0A138ZWZ5_GONPJ|nr:hypothetical protein M427DRAFT_50064 [Gonapodya prolifera JEL478]|eukprot:KXS09032.1 hypothetical protein M427DRAFT_50064 [Gonapodya prolifera JEL478]
MADNLRPALQSRQSHLNFLRRSTPKVIPPRNRPPDGSKTASRDVQSQKAIPPAQSPIAAAKNIVGKVINACRTPIASGPYRNGRVEKPVQPPPGIKPSRASQPSQMPPTHLPAGQKTLTLTPSPPVTSRYQGFLTLEKSKRSSMTVSETDSVRTLVNSTTDTSLKVRPKACLRSSGPLPKVGFLLGTERFRRPTPRAIYCTSNDSPPFTILFLRTEHTLGHSPLTFSTASSFNFLVPHYVFQFRGVSKTWCIAAESKYIRQSVRVTKVEVLDARKYLIKRTDDAVDCPGYNILTKRHVVINRLTGQPWTHSVGAWECERRPRVCLGPLMRYTSSTYEGITFAWTHEQKSYNPDSVPALDDLAAPLCRRSREEALQEFRAYRKRNACLSAAKRIMCGRLASIVVFFKPPAPGEVEIWTARDIEELVARSLERQCRRPLLCGINRIMLHDAPPEHIPTNVLYTRSWFSFESFGNLRDNSSASTFDFALNWNKVRSCASMMLGAENSEQEHSFDAKSLKLCSSATVQVIDDVVKQLLEVDGAVFIHEVKKALRNRSIGRFSYKQNTKLEKTILIAVGNWAKELKNLPITVKDKWIETVFRKAFPPRDWVSLPPTQGHGDMHDIFTHRVLSAAKLSVFMGNQINLIINELDSGPSLAKLEPPTVKLIEIVVNCLHNREPITTGDKVSPENLGISEEEFLHDYENIYARIIAAIQSMWYRLEFIDEASLLESEGPVQMHSTGFLEQIMSPRVCKRLKWNKVTRDGVSGAERRDTSVIGVFVIHDPDTGDTKIHECFAGIESKHGKNPKVFEDFRKALCDSARAVRKCRNDLGPGPRFLETYFVLAVGTTIEVFVTKEPFGESGIAISQRLAPMIRVPATRLEMTVDKMISLVALAHGLDQRINSMIDQFEACLPPVATARVTKMAPDECLTSATPRRKSLVPTFGGHTITSGSPQRLPQAPEVKIVATPVMTGHSAVWGHSSMKLYRVAGPKFGPFCWNWYSGYRVWDPLSAILIVLGRAG